MRVVVPCEVAERERRVALSPEAASKLVAAGHDVAIEPGAGAAAGFTDADYIDAEAAIEERSALVAQPAVVLQVRMSGTHHIDDGLAERLGPDHVLIGLADPLWRADNIAALAPTGVSVLALELVPRITRAQSMDVLSSMATVAGYEAVLAGAQIAPRMFPMLMTAAGTVPPTRVFVLGAGVAGLQAIATAKRLGAVVEAYDVRPAAAEQIESVGARSVQLEFDTGDSEDAGGYAKAQTEDQNAQQQRLLTPYLAASDVIITTAAIPGAASPELITKEMVEAMAPGTVIVDLAAERGGNCSLTVADEVVDHGGVVIIGPTDLASRSARNASQMFANNLVTLLTHLSADDGTCVLDADDEITGAMLVASDGQVCHERVQQRLEAGSSDT